MSVDEFYISKSDEAFIFKIGQNPFESKPHDPLLSISNRIREILTNKHTTMSAYFDELLADNNRLLLERGEELEKFHRLHEGFKNAVEEARYFLHGGTVRIKNHDIKKDSTIEREIKYPFLRVV